MQYLGGKHHIAQEVSTIVNVCLRLKGSHAFYVEPFVGGLNIAPLVRAEGKWDLTGRSRHCFDVNAALITLYRAMQQGWVPPSVLDETTYQQLKATKDPSNPLTAFAGFGCSFGAKWFGGYAADRKEQRYAECAANSLARKMSTCADVLFAPLSFFALEPARLADAVVYCDPPYAGTQQYDGAPKFDHDAFWVHCEALKAAGATVIVSEYDGRGRVPVWESTNIGTRLSTKGKGANTGAVERVFVL